MYTCEHTYTCKWLCNMPIIFCLVTVNSLLIREFKTRLCMCEYDHTTYYDIQQGCTLRTLELLMEMIMDDILLKKGLTCIYLKYDYR